MKREPETGRGVQQLSNPLEGIGSYVVVWALDQCSRSTTWIQLEERVRPSPDVLVPICLP
jgi:hypothetical protein